MKNLILAMLLGFSAHSAVAEVIPNDYGTFTNGQVPIVEDLHFTLLNHPQLEHGIDELWLEGILLFNFLFNPEPVTITFDIETPDKIKQGSDFTSSFVSSNFPCGHFGDWAELEIFPISSSDSNIQECGDEELQSKPSPHARSIKIDLQPIPEPGTYAMILLGLMLLGLITRHSQIHHL
jgi:hypothetical protein